MVLPFPPRESLLPMPISWDGDKGLGGEREEIMRGGREGGDGLNAEMAERPVKSRPSIP